MKRQVPVKVAIFLLLLLFPISRPAMAYIGPGAGLSAIGAFLAVVAGVVVAIFGFIWYPIKRLMRKWQELRNKEKDGGTE